MSSARQLNALSGDWVMDGPADGATDVGFEESRSAGLEMALLTLRTPLGECLADPTFGTDWARVAKVGPRAASDARAVIQTALTPLVRRNVIVLKAIVAEARADGRIFYAVDLVDVQTQRSQTARGTSP